MPPEYTDNKDSIPEGATVKYDVELLSLTRKNSARKENIFNIIDENGDNRLSRKETEKWFKAKHGKEANMPASLFEKDDTNKVCFLFSGLPYFFR